ncbi:MAG: phosphoglycerate dehydrogenase [Treponema sp.]|nr:phosphoglycerate dehydrogenase [Treponema sp.]
MKIAVTPVFFKQDTGKNALEMLRSFSDDIIFGSHGNPLSEDELIPFLSGCDGYIADLDFVTRKVIENTPGLKVISRFGVGYDRIDVKAAREKGIAVCNTPGANSNAVADLAFALLLGVTRKIPSLDSATRKGQWPRSTGVELYGKTIGILGLGAIGRAVAKRASGFSMKIMAYDPFIDREYAAANKIIAASFEEVIREADFISLHLPYSEKARYIISGKAMRNMKKGAVIINTARGGLIDETAACELLESGHLGGLGLDVFDTEPPGSSALFKLDNVVVTPHIGAYTSEAIAGMAELSVKNLVEVLSGKNCQNVVN